MAFLRERGVICGLILLAIEDPFSSYIYGFSFSFSLFIS